MGLFKKVEETKSGIKVLAFGDTGTGKTTFALSFPRIAALDSELGMEFYKGKTPNLLYHLPTNSADEVEEALEEINDELIDEIDTFIIDSETKIYENLQHAALQVAERRARNKQQNVDDANISTREWGKIKLINSRIQSAKIMLSSKGVNIVSICQEKPIKEKKGDEYVILGYEPDAAKGLKYDYDLVLRLFTAKDSKTKEEVYKAEVLKDRTGVFKKGDIIDNPTYEHWREVVEGKKNLKENVIDFVKNIDRDIEKIKSESETLEDITEKFKTLLKGLKDKSSVVTYSKQIGVDNPLKCNDLDKMRLLLEFVENLQDK